MLHYRSLGLPTHTVIAGSWALLGAKVPRDATVAQKLRAAGAILLGKTSLSQWANFRSFNTTNGWSARGGQVYSPYFPEGDPEGSSSGSSVATAYVRNLELKSGADLNRLGMALGSLGTDTDCSITLPASSNNLVGIRPSMYIFSLNFMLFTQLI